MLVAIDVYQQILSAIGRQFYGLDDDEDYDHLASLFYFLKVMWFSTAWTIFLLYEKSPYLLRQCRQTWFLKLSSS